MNERINKTINSLEGILRLPRSEAMVEIGGTLYWADARIRELAAELARLRNDKERMLELDAQVRLLRQARDRAEERVVDLEVKMGMRKWDTENNWGKS